MGEVTDLLYAIFVVMVAVVGIFFLWMAVTMALGWRRMRHQLRLVPGKRSPAPTRWLAPASERARLHRRLRQATASARAAAALGGSQYQPVLAGVESHALAIERTLLALPARGRASRPMRAAAAGEVRDLEQIVHQLSSMAAGHQQVQSTLAGPPHTPIDALHEQVTALTMAHAELDELERPPGSQAIADIQGRWV